MSLHCYENSQESDEECEDLYHYIEDEDCDDKVNVNSLFPSRSDRVNRRGLLVQWIANWLACVHIVMEESDGVHSLMIDTLKDLEILPLVGGKFASANDCGLFFPPDYNKGDSNSK